MTNTDETSSFNEGDVEILFGDITLPSIDLEELNYERSQGGGYIMNRGCVYKLKDGKELNPMKEIYNQHVYVIDFAKNPLKDFSPENTHVIYGYIDIESFNFGSEILGLDMLPYKDFRQYFDLFWSVDELNCEVKKKQEGM